VVKSLAGGFREKKMRLNFLSSEATNYFNAHYAGLSIEEVRTRLKHEIEALRGESATLMQAAVQASTEAMAESGDNVVVSGDRNLLGVQDFGNDMGSLRKLCDLFEQKTELMRLLDVSSRAAGVRIYIGGDSQVVPYEAQSVVTSPYDVDGRVCGTLGVIGHSAQAGEHQRVGAGLGDRGGNRADVGQLAADSARREGRSVKVDVVVHRRRSAPTQTSAYRPIAAPGRH
jgi:hypothetical protein